MLDDVTLHLVESFDDVEAYLRWLSEDRGRTWLACDLETGGLDWWREPIRTAQFGDTKHGWTIPYDRWGGLIEETFRRVHGVKYVAHNAKFDCEFLRHNRIKIPPFHDTMAMAYLIEPHRAKGLKAAAARHVDPRAGRAQTSLDVGMKKAKWTWATVPVDFPPYWKYAALDTVLTASLAEALWDKVQARYAAPYELQVRSDAVLLEMEMKGMRIDIPYVHDQRLAQEKIFNDLQEWFAQEHNLDPMKGQELVKFFWEQGIEIPLTTENGAPSVKKESLEMIDHPLVEKILAMRSAQKLGQTYFKNLEEYADGDGVLHPNINPLGAVTGRMSVSRPSLQNQPRSKLIRDAFVAREGNKMLLVDYQGQEMRVFAYFCQDPKMLEVYEDGGDLHNFAAEAIYGPGFTKKQRQTAKNGGFSNIYGAGLAKFSKTCGISQTEGQAFLSQYAQLFQNTKPFQAAVAKAVMERAYNTESKEYGWVTTLSGRNVPVPVKKAYVGVNYLIQGSCSDILRRALVDLADNDLADYLVLPIHDEVVFDIPKDEVEEVTGLVVEVLEKAAFNINVPMVAEPSVVERWGEKYD